MSSSKISRVRSLFDPIHALYRKKTSHFVIHLFRDSTDSTDGTFKTTPNMLCGITPFRFFPRRALSGDWTGRDSAIFWRKIIRSGTVTTGVPWITLFHCEHFTDLGSRRGFSKVCGTNQRRTTQARSSKWGNQGKLYRWGGVYYFPNDLFPKSDSLVSRSTEYRTSSANLLVLPFP